MYSRRRTEHTRRKLDVTVNEEYCIHGDEYFMSGYATFLFFYYTTQPHGVRSLSKDVIVFIYKLRAAWHFNLCTTHGLQNNVKVRKTLVNNKILDCTRNFVTYIFISFNFEKMWFLPKKNILKHSSSLYHKNSQRQLMKASQKNRGAPPSRWFTSYRQNWDLEGTGETELPHQPYPLDLTLSKNHLFKILNHHVSNWKLTKFYVENVFK